MADQWIPAQARGFGHSHSHAHGHGHGHGHSHDTTYLTSSNKDDPGVRITRIGLYVNLGMAIAKAAGGYAFNSRALTADAIHSLTDLISDFTTLATISYSIRAPTPRFPNGYGKIESLGALGVSGILLSGGIMIGWQAVAALCTQFFPELAHMLADVGVFGHGHGHSHSHTDLGPNINAAWLAGGSIVIKEWLYRSTMKIAKEKRSSVLASNAYHHRVDSLTAFVALATITASHFLSHAQWLDPVGGLIICGMIVQAGYGNTKSALLELADVGVDEEIRSATLSAAEQALEECQQELQDGFKFRAPLVQGTKSGQNFLVEVAIHVPSTYTMEQMSHVEERVRERVAGEVKGVKRVAVRFSTVEAGDDAFAKEFVTSKADEIEKDHDHQHEHDEHSHSHDNDHGHDHGPSTGTVKRR